MFRRHTGERRRVWARWRGLRLDGGALPASCRAAPARTGRGAVRYSRPAAARGSVWVVATAARTRRTCSGTASAPRRPRSRARSPRSGRASASGPACAPTDATGPRTSFFRNTRALRMRAAVAGRLLHALAEAPLPVARIPTMRRRPRLGLGGAPQRVGRAAGAAGAAHGVIARWRVECSVARTTARRLGSNPRLRTFQCSRQRAQVTCRNAQEQ